MADLPDPAAGDALPDLPTPTPQNAAGQGTPDDEQRGVPDYILSESAELWSAPLPHPQYLKEYNDVIPGFAKDLTSLFIEQANHRMDIERKITSSGIRATARGQRFALALGLAGLGVALAMVLVGFVGWAAGIAIVQIVSLTSAFIIGYHRRNDQTNE